MKKIIIAFSVIFASLNGDVLAQTIGQEEKMENFVKYRETEKSEGGNLFGKIISGNSLQQERMIEFKSQLNREYLKLADRLFANKNWSSATYYRRKAYDSLKRVDILPDNPALKRIASDIAYDELVKERYSLVKNLSTKVAIAVPEAAAKTLAYYDCWLESEVSRFRDERGNCKQSYKETIAYLKQVNAEVEQYTAMEVAKRTKDVLDKDEMAPNVEQIPAYEGDYKAESVVAEKDLAALLEKRKKQLAARQAAAAAAARAKAKAAAATNAITASGGKVGSGVLGGSTQVDLRPDVVYISYFSGAGSVLDDKAQAEIDKAIAQIKQANPTNINVNGHTDRSLTFDESLKVSKARADAVKNYMVSKGIAGDKITAFGFGKTDNLVDNKEGEAAAGNQRAEITFKQGNL